MNHTDLLLHKFVDATRYTLVCFIRSSKTLLLKGRGDMIFRLRPHSAAAFWKRSFVSTESLTIHTNPCRMQTELKNALQTKEFENASFAFSCERKTFCEQRISKRWRRDNHVISLIEFSSNTIPKWPVIAGFINLFGVVWTKTFHAFPKWKLHSQISPP